ncbi:MAG: ribonuclease J [Candidatus Magnetoglobus multicellularis str. Araruama]|uniref:Ribonuclease J n=1 Tax=Candidatus Magnetoglobus multicellularis str. Araruama TaxID=890399 RepID=A0A1V1PDH8_9BACT|nr:MAG: ribonuclease J [Candidatus Magnetoglobus multicellularis str. Araruama]
MYDNSDLNHGYPIMDNLPLKIIPLGGLGEVGLNMMVIEYNKTLIIIDAGLMFPEEYMLGIDIVIPDFSYAKDRAENVAAIILTHGHEDHIGALPYVLKQISAPIYGTAYTLGLIRYKLEEHDLLHQVSLHEIFPRQKQIIGPFELDFIRVSHSVVDCVGLAIQTPVGCIIHTGDFKLTPTTIEGGITDINAFALYGEKGVLALLSDSTNVEKEGYTIPEQHIRDRLEDIIMNSSGRVIVAMFASNIGRIQQIVEIAKKRNAKIVINGKSMEIGVNLAQELGYMTIPDDMKVSINEINEYPDHEVIIITTGSQGEPMSALARIATGMHKHIHIKQDDRVILSSKFIPGNERAIAKIINNLYKRGADVIYEKISDIHVSGHAFREELKMMIQLTHPRYFIPIHGEYRHLIHHARLAQSVGIPEKHILLAENGNIIEFKENEGKIVEKIETDRIMVDGKGVGDVGKSILRERKALSVDGFVVVTIIFDEETGIVVYGPEIDSRGFLFHSEKGHLLEDAKCVILEAIEETPVEKSDRVAHIREEVKRNLRQYFKFVIKRRPLIIPLILEV